MCKGDAHGEVERRMMPADSNLLNSFFAICNFSGSRRQDFAKTGGVATGMDVMLDPVGRCRLHIPGAKDRGEFLQQKFDISGHRIRDFLQGGGGRKGLILSRTKMGRLHLGVPG